MAQLNSLQLCTQGLTDADPLVRNGCLCWLEKLPYLTLEATRQAIRAYELYGPTAFVYPHMLRPFPLDATAVEEFHKLIDRLDPREDWSRLYHLLRYLDRGPVDTLPRLLARLDEYVGCGPDPSQPLSLENLRRRIRIRIKTSEMDNDACFDRMYDLFEEMRASNRFPDALLWELYRICDRLIDINGPDDLEPVIDEWLDFEPDDADLPLDWDVQAGVYLSGKTHYTGSWRRLLALFLHDDEVLNEELQAAFVNMATPSLIDDLILRFRDLDWVSRLFLSELFETHPLPQCERLCASLVMNPEEDELIRESCAMSLALLGTPRSLQMAQAYYDLDPAHPESETIGQMLYVQYRLRGIDHPAIDTILHYLAGRGVGSTDPLPGLDGAHGSAPASDVIPFPTPAVKVDGPGRNDPCPCGSGKKYKKCCLHKS